MNPSTIYSYTESLLRIARTVAASHAADIALDRVATKAAKGRRLSALRADCADVPEVTDVIDSIVAAHAPELLDGDPPHYSLAP